MKLLFFLFIATVLYAEHIRWSNDFEKSLLEAKQTNKDILLLVLKKESLRSKTVFSDIFIKEDVQKAVNKKYIPIAVFFEDKNSYPIELFYTQIFPALFFVSSKDESYLHKPLSGNFTKEELLEALDFLTKP